MINGYEPLTPAQQAFQDAIDDTVATVICLERDGRQHRASALAVAADLGTSAAFMFSIDDQAYRNATAFLREAITTATREED